MITIESTTVEGLIVEIVTDADPTAAVPEFAVTTGERGDPSGFADGSWIGSWSETTGRIKAKTATIGAVGADLTVEAGSVYDVWMRWSTSTDTPAKLCGHITVR